MHHPKETKGKNLLGVAREDRHLAAVSIGRSPLESSKVPLADPTTLFKFAADPPDNRMTADELPLRLAPLVSSSKARPIHDRSVVQARFYPSDR